MTQPFLPFGPECPICRQTLPRELVQDHCHTTGLNRERICGSCNGHLGFYEKTCGPSTDERLGRLIQDREHSLSNPLPWWTQQTADEIAKDIRRLAYILKWRKAHAAGIGEPYRKRRARHVRDSVAV